MFQTFDVTSRPDQGPPRLAALRAEMATHGLDGFLVPRADLHQGEYVAPRDSRLAWLTGFTGSAGLCVVLGAIAGVFIDGRYRVQVKDQVDLQAFTPVNWPETALGDWLIAQAPAGAVIGFDPWLHSRAEIDKLEAALKGHGVTLRACANLIDRIWEDQPPAPKGKVVLHPVTLAGHSAAEKRVKLARDLQDAGQAACVLTLPDSISWLLNIRGSDVPRTPVVHALAVLQADETLDLFIDPDKLDPPVRAALQAEARLHPPAAFMARLETLQGPVRVDPDSAPVAVLDALGDRAVAGSDPCLLPKATKTAAEIEGTRHAHLRDAVAMVRFLAWLEDQRDALLAGSGPALTEIDVVTALEGFRRETNRLEDISFETIAGSGPNGAIVHYRVSTQTNRSLRPGDVLLVDSGGQYVDGTTDITRTIAMGPPPEGAADAYTRVLQGMIAISRARWPRGLAGRDLDPLARAPLWMAGQDYDHGTGHGVGAYLSVHEGPQRLSRAGTVPLEPGMILSNEPGYYREGAFGIRLENLVVVREAAALPGGDDRVMLCFETLTWVPFDRRMILADRLSPDELVWLNAYHAGVAARLSDRLTPEQRGWLAAATAPI